MSIRRGIAIALLAASTLSRTGACTEAALYVDLRPGVQLTDVKDSTRGLADFGSRIGGRLFVPAPTFGERTGALVHLEMGTEDEETIRPTHRLLYYGFKGELGQLTYGTQWGAFYAAVGQYLDPGLKFSGFGYEGATRSRRSLQYARAIGEGHVQADLVRDPHAGGGFNRLQASYSFQGTTWRFGLAADLSEGRANTDQLSAEAANASEDIFDRKKLCQSVLRVDCFGASLGWRLRERRIDAGVMSIRARGNHGFMGGIVMQETRHKLSYRVEASATKLSRTANTSMTIAAGAEYQLKRWLGLFAEGFVSSASSRDQDFGIGFGVRVRYTDYFH